VSGSITKPDFDKLPQVRFRVFVIEPHPPGGFEQCRGGVFLWDLPLGDALTDAEAFAVQRFVSLGRDRFDNPEESILDATLSESRITIGAKTKASVSD
jgi:hypothetical protein